MRLLAPRLLTGLAWPFAALLALAASGADAPAVFADASSEGLAPGRPAGLRELDRVPEQEAPYLRTSRLDFEVLRALRQTAKLGRSSRARLDLFEGAEFDWIPRRTAATSTGYSLSGPLAGVEGGTATLVVNGDVAVGSVWTPEGAYRIRTAGRIQVIERIEPLRAKMCEGPLLTGSTTPQGGVIGTASAPEDDGAEIDVLAVYTAPARRRAGGHRAILAEIDHRVAWTNEAYAISDVVHRVRLAGASEVDYDEIERFRDLHNLAGMGDGHMDEVHALRDRLAADIVVLWTTNGGIAYGGWAAPAVSYSRDAFATVGVGKLTTFAHELGHVMGLRHHRADDNINLPFPYSHGYVLRGIRDESGFGYSTVMQSSGGNLPRFSNPRQRFRGVPLGVPGEEPTPRTDGPADAARSMNETRPYIANYRRSATRCRYGLSVPPTEVPAGGGSYTLRIEADADCPWTVRDADGFTTVTSGASGTGDGTVAYRVPANEGWLREVALVVAGRMHIVVQPGLRSVKPVCERSAQVRELIEAELEADCADIADADLSKVTKLDIGSRRDPFQDPLQPSLGDFDGLSNLGDLRLIVAEGGDLPAGVFDGLTSVTVLELWGDDISLQPGSFHGLRNASRLEIRLRGDQPVPPGAFEGMPRLIRMSYIGDRPIAPGAFEGLSGLRDLTLWGAIAHLPVGTFRGLPNLRQLEVLLHEGPPITVAPGLLDDLPDLELLKLYGLADIRAGLFRSLSALRELRLQYNAFTSLPPGVFEGLSSLWLLILGNGEPISSAPSPYRHELSALPPGLFSGLSNLSTLVLDDVGLRELRQGAFREVGSTLRNLHLQDNELTVLDVGTFDGLPKLWTLDLAHNQLAALPSGVFRGLRNLRFLSLDNNRLRTLPPGLFTGVATDSKLAFNSVHFGVFELTLHGNLGAPFTLAIEQAVASEPWRRPVRVAAYLAEGAPFPVVATFHAVDGRPETGSAALAIGTTLSEPFAVRPVGSKPVVVRIAGLTDLPGQVECAAYRDADRPCRGYPNYTGIALKAGAPLVLNGVSDRREFDQPAEIDLANVFLEFDDSAVPTFSVSSSDPSVAKWELTDRLLKLAPTDAGTTTVTVTATAGGRTTIRTFSITVPTEERRFMRGWRLTLLNDDEGAQ